MTKDEALDLALEALVGMDILFSPLSRDCTQHNAVDRARKAITDIKQARALDKKAENARELGLDYEPVFCEYCGGNDDADFGLPTDHCTDCARPQAAQPAPVQEPVAKVAEVHMSRYTLEWTNGPLSEGTELFDRPAAQRPFVGLTDEEIEDIVDECDGVGWDVAQAIKAKLKERNV
jgi:hypothetical protein